MGHKFAVFAIYIPFWGHHNIVYQAGMFSLAPFDIEVGSTTQANIY